MDKKRALICVSLAALFAGCGSESPQHSSTPSTPVAAAPATKPVMEAKPTAQPPSAQGAPMPTPTPAPMPTPTAPMPAAVWDAPVDGRPVFMKVRGEGVQIYVCKKDSKGAFMWALTAPEALLYNDKGRAIGKHGAGPSWELSDGSKVIAEKIASMPKEKSIPDMLLKTISTNGTGALAKVKYVKRIETDGGLPPTMAADAGSEGKEERVPYRATYVFYAGS